MSIDEVPTKYTCNISAHGAKNKNKKEKKEKERKRKEKKKEKAVADFHFKRVVLCQHFSLVRSLLVCTV